MKYRVRINEQVLARRVQRRIRGRRIFVHNLLVRLVVRTAMDVLTEMPPRTREMFIEGWFLDRGNVQVPARRWNRVVQHLTKLYSERMIQERALRYWAAVRHLKPMEILTDMEIAALLEARRDAVSRDDQALVDAIDKALKCLRIDGATRNTRR